MQITKAEIRGFGCLEQRTFLFAPGLNLLYGDNGSGKSTLLAFVEAMFWGLGGRRRRLGDDWRRRYRPWHGADFGGSLFFTWQGQQWQLTRRFGEQPRGDRCQWVNLTKGEVVDFGQSEPGQVIWQISQSTWREMNRLNTQNIEVHLDAELEEKWSQEAGKSRTQGPELTAIRRYLEKERQRLRGGRGQRGQLETLQEEQRDLLQQWQQAKAFERERALLEQKQQAAKDDLATRYRTETAQKQQQMQVLEADLADLQQKCQARQPWLEGEAAEEIASYLSAWRQHQQAQAESEERLTYWQEQLAASQKSQQARKNDAAEADLQQQQPTSKASRGLAWLGVLSLLLAVLAALLSFWPFLAAWLRVPDSAQGLLKGGALVLFILALLLFGKCKTSGGRQFSRADERQTASDYSEAERHWHATIQQHLSSASASASKRQEAWQLRREHFALRHPDLYAAWTELSLAEAEWRSWQAQEARMQKKKLALLTLKTEVKPEALWQAEYEKLQLRFANERLNLEGQQQEGRALKEGLERNQAALLQAERDAEALDLALSWVKNAEEHVEHDFLAPLQAAFEQQRLRLQKAIGQTLPKAVLQADLSLHIQDSSAFYRLFDYYSDGWQDLYRLLLRLSLQSVQKAEQASCLLWDEPTARLDKKHQAAVLAMLEESLFEEQQLFWASCREELEVLFLDRKAHVIAF